MADKKYEYARDDFSFPNWLQKLLLWKLGLGETIIRNSGFSIKQVEGILYALTSLSFLGLIFNQYIVSAIGLGLWIFIENLYFRIFVDEPHAPNMELRHFFWETPFVVALTIYMGMQGHVFTTLAAILGLAGLFFISNMKNKYDLKLLALPVLYFYRRDRLGWLFVTILLAALPGERSILFPIIGAWGLFVLTAYDYFWTMIQIVRRKPR
jgi:hypothetical protein